MNKDLIRQRFSKNLCTYNENANIQKKMAEKLVSILDTKNFNDILEIGCGTGLLTQIAVNKFEFKTYTANDIVSECSDFISEINSNIEFIPGDIEEIIETSDKKYDLIISNASLQWVENFENIINKLISKLQENGILLFSTFGKENFREIFFTLGEKLSYYSFSEIKEMFSKYNLKIEEEIHVMTFSSPKEVLKHLHYTGVNGIKQNKWTKKDMKQFENGYNNFCSNRPTLTYNPIYIMIKM